MTVGLTWDEAKRLILESDGFLFCRVGNDGTPIGLNARLEFRFYKRTRVGIDEYGPADLRGVDGRISVGTQDEIFVIAPRGRRGRPRHSPPLKRKRGRPKLGSKYAGLISKTNKAVTDKLRSAASNLSIANIEYGKPIQ